MVIHQARKHLIDFEIATDPNYNSNWHHEVIAEELEHIATHGDRDYKILILMVPPRHGKTRQATIDFPAWYLGNNPNGEIITASYSSELAQDFGTKTRTLVQSPEYQAIFDTRLKQDEQAKAKWRTAVEIETGVKPADGSYTSVGVGGPITGRGANILIIDDPIRNREEAESEVYREKTYEWFTSTGFTRLEPKGVVVLIQCMTGDTPVVLTDGKEKPLRDIRRGDKVGTYKNGKLETSFVRNCGSNGLDNVFVIKTNTGKIVRANERHPFLTYYNGELKWTKTKNLTTDHKIVTLKGSGESGRGKPVLSVINQLVQGVIAPLTMLKRCGLTGIVHHLTLMQGAALVRNLNTAMELLLKSMRHLMKDKVASVQYANSHQAIMFAPTGKESSALTTATKQEKSERYSAMTATSQSDMQKTNKQPALWQNTSDFTLEDILSIKEDGVEEVFDIQVDETENFIANGIVSHNTRWHQDDLAGRIISSDDLSKRTKILKFPAFADHNEEHRKKGEALWPTKYNEHALYEIKDAIGPYDFASLYQQTPILTEDQEFKPEWYRYITAEEVERMNTRNFLTIDTAMSKRTGSDYTGIVDNSVNKENYWHVKGWRMKLGPEELVDMLFTLHTQRKYEKIGIEKTAYLEGLKPFLDSEQRKRGQFLPIVELKHNQTVKETRIRGLQPRYASGSIYHIQGECKALEEEQASFPLGVHDDVLDGLAYQLQIAEKAFTGARKSYTPTLREVYR